MSHSLRHRLTDAVTSVDTLWLAFSVLVGTAYAGGGV